MKKIILSVVAFLFVHILPAQNTVLHDARESLSHSDYSKAIPILDEAINKEETRNNAETWFLRGIAYQMKAGASSENGSAASSDIAYSSLMKALELNPAYDQEINNTLSINATKAFNQGVELYATNPSGAYDKFMRVITIYNAGDGKRFIANADFTDLLMNAKTNAAYSAYAAKKDAEAISMLNELRSFSDKDSVIYRTLVDVYERQNNHEQELAVIKEAIGLFPSNKNFRDLGINWYISHGSQEALIAKLEDAVKKDPANSELAFNLANSYLRMAFPKDNAGQSLPKPANFDLLFSKAEANYEHAVKIHPGNADYNYNYGVLYYTYASELIATMNKITGTSAEENKEYDRYKVLLNDYFTKALPYFEKAYSVLDPHAPSLDDGGKTTYRNTLTGLYAVYSHLDKKEKADEVKLKIQGL